MNRRQFLVGAAGSGAASIAGCSAFGDDGGSDGDATWSGSLGDLLVSADLEPADNYHVLAGSPAALEEYGTEDVGSERRLRTWVDTGWREFDYVEVDLRARVSPGPVEDVGAYTVTDGSFDAADVADDVTAHVEELESRSDVDEDDVGFERSYRGYDRYRLPSVTVAVHDGRVLECYNRVEDGAETEVNVERVVDSVESDSESVLEDHDGLATVADRIGPGVQWSFGTFDPDHDGPEGPTTEGRVALAKSSSIDGGECTRRVLWAFESADQIDDDAVASYVEDFGGSDYDDVEYEVDGDVLEVTATGAVEDVLMPYYLGVV